MFSQLNRCLSLLVVLPIMSTFAPRASAGPGSLDTSYGGSVSSGPVYASAVQPDGRVLIGGGFSFVNGSSSRYHLARLMSDGSLDPGFFNTGSGVSSIVWSLALQPDNRILIGGDFTSINGTSRTRVARLNANGSVDGTFVPTNIIGASVLAVASWSNNAVIIGGNFSNTGFPSWVARLGSDGSVDNSFVAFPNGSVSAIAVQPDGRILLGGSFTQLNGASRGRMGRVNADGSLDGTFQNNLGGVSGTVRCIQVQPDGRILIGGDFSTVNGTTRQYIARLNSNGTLDSGFTTTSGANNYVYAIAVQPDNNILISGAFTSFNQASASHVARLYPDGTRDTTFTNFGINSIVQTLALQTDGGVLIGGPFTTINNTNWSYFGRLYGNIYPPEFLTQPISRATNVGATVKFSAQVSNPTSSNFQWRKNGGDIPGATGSSYTLVNVQFADAGSYSVFVNNALGGITSSNAVLLVGVAPAIIVQPVSLTVTQGQSASFSVTATGTPLNYYWKKSGVLIPGATNSSFNIASAALSNAATFTCQVSNFLGSVTSVGATLSVYGPPIITVQPASRVVGVGSNFTVSVVGSANPAPAYQWQKDGAEVPGATASSLTITSAQTNDAGGYAVVLTNQFGSVTSAIANITIQYYPPSIVTQPLGATLLVGSNLNLSVTANGTAPLFYQWRQDGADLAGATTNTCFVSDAQTNHSGDYTVVITNLVGGITSSVARVNVGYAPVILQQPQSFTNTLGTSNALTVAVSGSDPIIYQWFKEGLPITDATNHLLIFTSLQSNHVGNYFVNITNLYGTAGSSNAQITVPGQPLPFMLQGLAAYYPFNGNANDESGNSNHAVVTGATLTPDRLGTPARAYFLNGTSDYLTIPDAPANDLAAQFTICFWLNPIPGYGTPVSGDCDILNKWGNGAIGEASFQVGVKSAGQLFFATCDGANTSSMMDTAVLTTGAWHQVVVTRDAAGFALYVDNSLHASSTNLVPPQSSVLNLGFGREVGGAYAYYGGGLDEVRLYNRALSSNEVAQLYQYDSQGMAQPTHTLFAHRGPEHALVLDLQGLAGRSYVLESTTNLNPPLVWQAQLTNVTDTNGFTQFTETTLNQIRKLYRATLVP